MMMQNADISLLKQVLTSTNAFDVDWRYYSLWNKLLLHYYAQKDLYPYHRVKYMIDQIKCNPNDPKYELLHVAANRHDLRLLNICLDEYNINPLSVNARWNKTALEECNY